MFIYYLIIYLFIRHNKTFDTIKVMLNDPIAYFSVEIKSWGENKGIIEHLWIND